MRGEADFLPVCRESLPLSRWALGSNVMVRQYAMRRHIGESTSNFAASQAS